MVSAIAGLAEVFVLGGVFLFFVVSVGGFLYSFGSSNIDAESSRVAGMVVWGLLHVLFFLGRPGVFNSPFFCLYSLRRSFVLVRFLSGRY